MFVCWENRTDIETNRPFVDRNGTESRHGRGKFCFLSVSCCAPNPTYQMLPKSWWYWWLYFRLVIKTLMKMQKSTCCSQWSCFLLHPSMMMEVAQNLCHQSLGHQYKLLRIITISYFRLVPTKRERSDVQPSIKRKHHTCVYNTNNNATLHLRFSFYWKRHSYKIPWSCGEKLSLGT